MVSAQSICFDPFGEKLYAGLKNEIRIFDVNVPGKTKKLPFILSK
jgi:hypothetical protein